MEQNKMAPAPWAINKFNDRPDHIFSTSHDFGSANIICWCPKNQESAKRFATNAAAIVSAVNNTYGAGINPEAVKDLYDNLKDAIIQLQYMHDKFMPTGSGNAVISRCQTAIEKAELQPEPKS